MSAAEAQTPLDRSANLHKAAGIMIIAAAGFRSVVPAIIHQTARDSNPFFFNCLGQATGISVLLVLLVISRRRWVDDFKPNGYSGRLDHRSVWDMGLFKSYIGPNTKGKGENHAVGLLQVTSAKPSSWLRLPIAWLMLGGLDVGLLAWSARYVETAIAATIYELWPAFVVFMLLRHNTTYRLYLKRAPREGSKRNHGHLEQAVFTVLAGIGLAFMLGSQAETSAWLDDVLTIKGVLGVVLALLASFGAALNVVGSLVFGRTAYYRFTDDLPHSDTPAEDRGHQDMRLILWFVLFGLVIGRAFSVVASFVLGLAVSNAYGGVTLAAVLGAVVLGATNGFNILLTREGNIRSKRPGVNMLSFVAPALALAWLMTLGIELPRLDLFVVGAALILAINVLLQLKPDEERDYARFGKEPRRGTRLGFTAFIMSIWVFGTVIYLRDDLFPAAWLTWSGEYWGMLALSATVFSLILGFRMARLTARISHEDELMFQLFRHCEQLEREDVLDPAVRQRLAELDTATPGELLDCYNEARRLLRNGTAGNRTDADATARLLDAERLLDVIAHSKQQGRDLVELMSLMAFALVTIGLGLFSRPFTLELQDHAWSGFISEVFVLLLTSTVAFLAVNLFDIRRDRETPLLVPLTEHDNDYRLFFRYKRTRYWQHGVAVAVSAAMAIVFVLLLHGKWQ